MPPATAPHPRVFVAHPVYRVLAAFSALGAGLLAWQLWRGVDPITPIILGICLVLLVRFLRFALARVTLDAQGVAVQMPWRAPRAVAFRQLSAVHEEGRGIRSILLLYHPQAGNGLLDLEGLHSLALPAVREQSELFQTLSDRTPA